MLENAISESKALKLEPGRWKVSHVENKCKGPEAERNLKCLRKTSVNRENGVKRQQTLEPETQAGTWSCIQILF